MPCTDNKIMDTANIKITKYGKDSRVSCELMLSKTAMTRLEEGCFRAELRSEGRLVECFDIRLTRASHRQWLGDYISDRDVTGVWFSTTGLNGDNWYSKEAFMKSYSYCNLSFLEHLDIN